MTVIQTSNNTTPPTGVQVVDSMGIYADAIQRVTPDSIQHLRSYLMDYPEKNPLLDYQREFKDGEVALAILNATSFYNSIPPIASKATVTPGGAGMPFNLFLGFGAIALLETSGLMRLRNEVPVSDSGVSVDLMKSDKYFAALDRWRAYYTEAARRFKMSVNSRSLGSFVPSGYLYTYLVR